MYERSLEEELNENDCIGLNLADSLTGLKHREGGIVRGKREKERVREGERGREGDGGHKKRGE